MPGLPNRQHEEEDHTSGAGIPPPPAIPRSPTPETPAREESPVRIAMPVSRTREPTKMEDPAEHDAPIPVKHIEDRIPHERELTDEPTGHDPARGAGVAVAAATFGAGAAAAAGSLAAQAPETSVGLRAVAIYDYEKAEDNEIEFADGETITEIEQVDPDW